jgi:hypothetical protein
MSRKLDAMLLSGTGFSLCICRHGAELEGEYIRQNPVKRALVEHPDSYEWLFIKSITG